MCAGIIAGNGATGETDENGALYGLGVAPGASLVAQRIFDGAATTSRRRAFETLTRDAKRAGADIGSNSWGDDTQGRYDISAMEFDALVRDADALALGDQPTFWNSPPATPGPATQTIGSPAVGQERHRHRRSPERPPRSAYIYDDGPDAMADFSSRGPCEDGRIKPDVVAPGTWIASLQSASANDDYAWWPISTILHVSGRHEPGRPARVRRGGGVCAVLPADAHERHALARPGQSRAHQLRHGHGRRGRDRAGAEQRRRLGRVDLPAFIASARDYDFMDQDRLLDTGQIWERRVLVGNDRRTVQSHAGLHGRAGISRAQFPRW